ASLRARIMSVPGVARVERWEGQMMKTGGGQVLLEGVESNTQLYRHPLLAGRWFNGNEQNVMVISDNLANKAHLKVGGTITFSSSTKTATWKIIGEMHNLNGTSGGQLGGAVTTIDNLHRFLDFPASMAYSFMIGASDHAQPAVDRLANRLDDTLSRAGLAPSVTTSEQVVQRNQAQFEIIDVLLYAVAAIVALVGILGLFNTLTTSILERRRELGTLRAIGATRRQIAGISWLEGIVLALLAWIIAVLIGVPSA
ncbi:MAG: ABC transporter permease, partial [Chloroflexota bacterium]|nr:ABC transporter permease [Chloroflexota bacterium]